MPLTLSASHPIFVLPSDRSRSYLRWAKWLAYIEGTILLMGSLMILSRTGVAHMNQLAIGAAALAILSLSLGLHVGRGSARAGVILLGLAISRGVMTFVPGAPDWWTTFPLLTVLELFVFAQAVRAAVALTRDEDVIVTTAPITARAFATAPPIPKPHAQTTAPTAPRPFRYIAPVPDPQAELIGPRSPFVDYVVAGVIGVFSLFAMNTHIPSGEGLMGVGETLLVLFGFFNFVLVVILLVSAAKARKGKRWAQRVRGGVYWLLLGEVMLWIRLKI
jgi:hypothetical protein